MLNTERAGRRALLFKPLWRFHQGKNQTKAALLKAIKTSLMKLHLIHMDCFIYREMTAFSFLKALVMLFYVKTKATVRLIFFPPAFSSCSVFLDKLCALSIWHAPFKKVKPAILCLKEREIVITVSPLPFFSPLVFYCLLSTLHSCPLLFPLLSLLFCFLSFTLPFSVSFISITVSCYLSTHLCPLLSHVLCLHLSFSIYCFFSFFLSTHLSSCFLDCFLCSPVCFSISFTVSFTLSFFPVTVSLLPSPLLYCCH